MEEEGVERSAGACAGAAQVCLCPSHFNTHFGGRSISSGGRPMDFISHAHTFVFTFVFTFAPWLSSVSAPTRSRNLVPGTRRPDSYTRTDEALEVVIVAPVVG